MNRNRIVVLVVVAVVAFGGAYLLFRDDGSSSEDAQVQTGGGNSGGCAANAAADTSYEVKLEEQPKVEAKTVTFALAHNGKAVNDAKVCLDVAMTGMSHPPARGGAKPISGGRYQVETKFAMRGPWAGSVTVTEPGKSAISVPISFDVQ